MSPSLIEGLERDAKENRELAAQCIHAPKAKALYTGMASRCEEAAKALKALQYPDARLVGSKALVLYFPTEVDRENFVEAVKGAKPTMTCVAL